MSSSHFERPEHFSSQKRRLFSFPSHLMTWKHWRFIELPNKVPLSTAKHETACNLMKLCRTRFTNSGSAPVGAAHQQQSSGIVFPEMQSQTSRQTWPLMHANATQQQRKLLFAKWNSTAWEACFQNKPKTEYLKRHYSFRGWLILLTLDNDSSESLSHLPVLLGQSTSASQSGVSQRGLECHF